MILFYFFHGWNLDKHFFIKANTNKEAYQILKRKKPFTYRNYIKMCAITDTVENRNKYLKDNIILNEH